MSDTVDRPDRGPGELPPVRIVLRPLGSPLTVAASGLAIASLVQSGLDLHWIAASQRPTVGLILVSVPFLLQFLASIVAYLSRDAALGAGVGILSTGWLASGLVAITSAPGSESGALGLALLAGAGLLVMTSLSAAMTKPLVGLMVLLAALRFAATGIAQLGAGSGWTTLSGDLGIAVVAVAAYNVLAFELEGQFNRPLLPTLRRRITEPPPGGDPRLVAAATGGITHEPGVRHGT